MVTLCHVCCSANDGRQIRSPHLTVAQAVGLEEMQCPLSVHASQALPNNEFQASDQLSVPMPCHDNPLSLSETRLAAPCLRVDETLVEGETWTCMKPVDLSSQMDPLQARFLPCGL